MIFELIGSLIAEAGRAIVGANDRGDGDELLERENASKRHDEPLGYEEGYRGRSEIGSQGPSGLGGQR